MPSGSTSTGRVKPARSALRVNWTQPDEIRLIKLVRSNAGYKLTFFPTGMAKRMQWHLGRDLCIDFMKADRNWIRDWKQRKLITKKADGDGWEATAEWISSVPNPVLSKLRELKKSFEDARKKHGHRVNESWTKFSELPRWLRADLVDKCPLYFHLKPLFAKPEQDDGSDDLEDDDYPIVRPPSPIQSRRAPIPKPRSARPVHAPPSPSPSLSPPSVARLISPVASLSLSPIRSLTYAPPPASPPTRRNRGYSPSRPVSPHGSTSTAGPSSAFSLRPTTHRHTTDSPPAIAMTKTSASMTPQPIASSSRAPMVIEISSTASSTSSSSTDSEFEPDSEHDMEDGWAADVTRSPSPPKVDWLNLKVAINPNVKVEQPNEQSHALDSFGTRKRHRDEIMGQSTDKRPRIKSESPSETTTSSSRSSSPSADSSHSDSNTENDAPLPEHAHTEDGNRRAFDSQVAPRSDLHLAQDPLSGQDGAIPVTKMSKNQQKKLNRRLKDEGRRLKDGDQVPKLWRQLLRGLDIATNPGMVLNTNTKKAPKVVSAVKKKGWTKKFRATKNVQIKTNILLAAQNLLMVKTLDRYLAIHDPPLCLQDCVVSVQFSRKKDVDLIRRMQNFASKAGATIVEADHADTPKGYQRVHIVGEWLGHRREALVGASSFRWDKGDKMMPKESWNLGDSYAVVWNAPVRFDNESR